MGFFLRKANFVLFKSSDPHVKMELFQAYCLSFYGSSLWRLDCPELNSLSVAFDNVVRRIGICLKGVTLQYYIVSDVQLHAHASSEIWNVCGVYLIINNDDYVMDCSYW